MKTINVTFTDDEHEAIKNKISESNAENWHDFILLSSGVIKKKDLKK